MRVECRKMSEAKVGFCIVLRSACDAWQPVLTGAVFNLVNGDQHEVARESHFLPGTEAFSAAT